MNLINFRAGLKSLSDYAPTAQIYQNELDAITNIAYLNLWVQKRWNFTIKSNFFRFYPDLDFARTGANLNVFPYIRQFTFSSPLHILDKPWLVEGQILEVQGIEYTVIKVVDNTTIRVAEPFLGDSTSDDETWKLKFKYYYLPEDAMELLYVGHSDSPIPGSGQKNKGKLLPVSPRMEEQMNLEEDRTSDGADFYIPCTPIVIPPAEKIRITVEEAAAATTNIPGDYYFEVCWAFEKGGLVGPLSKPEIGNTGVEGQDLKWKIILEFISHDDVLVEAPTFLNTRDTHPNPYEGLRKRVYFNQNFNHVTGERLGNPAWREIRDVGMVANQYNHRPIRVDDEDSSVTLVVLDSMSPANPRYIETDGQHTRIRPYPRVDSWDYKVEYDNKGTPIVPEEYILYGEMRYVYKPHQLATDTDTPEMPYEFHQLLMWTALSDIYAKHGDNSTSLMYEGRINKRIKGLGKRYTDYVDVLYRRGQFGAGRTGQMIDGSVVYYNGIRM